MSSSVGTSPGTLDRAGVRAWLGLALLAVSCALVSANANLLNLALPSIAAELRPNGAQLLWISDAYAFAVAGLLMPAGLAADRLGRRRVLLGGAALFGLASIGASLSTSAGSLIAFRVLLGAAGALLGPSTISLIRSMFPDPRQRAVALGVWTAGFALGGIVGPPVGGVLLAAAGWRAVFALAPPVMALVVLLGRFTLPEYRQASTRPLDWVGLVVMIVGLLTTVTAVKQVAGGAPFLLPTVVASVGLVLLVGSLERQARIANPVLDMGLFRSAATLVPLTTNALAFAVLYGNQLLTGQYLQAVLGMSALEAGAWTIPSACAYALGGLVSGRLVARWGPSAVLAGGLALSATGFGVQAFVGASDGAVVYLVGSVVAALGLAPVYLVSTESTVAAMPTERAGVAGATLETLTNVGGALGVAVFGSLLNAVYLTRTSGLAVQTRSIGDAAVAASGLDGPAAAAVLTTARLAFVAGFRLVAAIGAALLLVAFVAVVVTGSTHPTSRPGPRDDVENATS